MHGAIGAPRAISEARGAGLSSLVRLSCSCGFNRSPLLKDLGKGDLYFDRMFLGQHGNNDRYRQGYLIKVRPPPTRHC